MHRSTALALTGLCLMACASNPRTSSQPSTLPMVNCREHEPFESLPGYPTPVGNGSPDDTRAYSSAQSVWAATAAGIFQRNAIKRRATATCLDDLRSRGLIL